MSGLTIGMLAIGGTMAYGSSAGWFGDPGGAEMNPTMMHEMPRDQWAIDLNQKTSENMGQMWDSLNRGEMPEWYKNSAADQQAGMERDLSHQVYGGGSQMTGPSMMQTARNTGAALGLGPKGTIAQTDKVQSAYLDKLQGIHQYMAGKRLDYGQQVTRDLMYGTPQQSQGPQTQMTGGDIYQRAPSAGASAAGAIGSGMMGMAGGMYGSGGGGGMPAGGSAASYNPQNMGGYSGTVPRSGMGYTPIHYSSGM